MRIFTRIYQAVSDAVVAGFKDGFDRVEAGEVDPPERPVAFLLTTAPTPAKLTHQPPAKKPARKRPTKTS